MKVIEIKTTDEFKELIFDYETETEWNFKGDKNTLVDFYSDTCSPCKMVISALEKATDDDRFVIYKINCGALPEIASVFGVTTVPMMLFVDGTDKTKEPKTHVGAIPVKKIIELLETI